MKPSFSINAALRTPAFKNVKRAWVAVLSCADHEIERVGAVDAGVEAPEEHQQEGVDPDEVVHEDVAAPRRREVRVAPVYFSCFAHFIVCICLHLENTKQRLFTRAGSSCCWRSCFDAKKEEKLTRDETSDMHDLEMGLS